MSNAVWPSDPRHATGLQIIDDDINKLRGDEMLLTRLLDYLLQRGLHSAKKSADLLDAEFNVCCGSTASADIMDRYNHILRSRNLSTSRSSISTMRKKMAGFSSGRHKLVFPHVGNLHFFVIVITHDASLEDPWLTVDCYDSLRASRNRNRSIHGSSEFGKFLITFSLFWNKFIWWKTKDKREVNYKDLLVKGCIQPCPQQRNGIDCGLFAVAVTMYVIDDIPLLETSFSQENISAFRFCIVSACDNIDPIENPGRDPTKYLPRDLVRRNFPLLLQPSHDDDIEFIGKIAILKKEEEHDSDIEMLMTEVIDKDETREKTQEQQQAVQEPSQLTRENRPLGNLKTTGLLDSEEKQESKGTTDDTKQHTAPPKKLLIFGNT